MPGSRIEDRSKKTDRKGRQGGRYASLNLASDENGYYVIGRRLINKNLMTPGTSLQKLMAIRHPVTRLFIERAHKESEHRSRDVTLADFRLKYWTAHGCKIAQSAKIKCQLCKLRDVKFGTQEMGKLAKARLKQAPPFTYTCSTCLVHMLFVESYRNGHAVKRMESYLRTWSLELYSSKPFTVMIRLHFCWRSRFASVPGWPQLMYSDPG